VVESNGWDLFEIVENSGIPEGNLNAQFTCMAESTSIVQGSPTPITYQGL